MIEIGIVIITTLILWKFLFKPKKEEPIDITKNSEWYVKEYPDIIKPYEGKEDLKEEKPTIIINITNNHLHIQPEGKKDNPNTTTDK